MNSICMRTALVMSVGLIAVPCTMAQDVAPEEMTPEQAMEMMAAAGRPTAEHKRLGKMAGDWVFEGEFFWEPGAPATPVHGTTQAELALGGVCLVMNTRMTMEMGEQPMDISGMCMMGFNPHTGEFESSWMDTSDPYLLVQRGVAEPDVITLTGTGVSMMGEMTLKNVYSFQDEDHYTLSFHAPIPGGGEMKVGELRCARVKPTSDDMPTFVYFIHPTHPEMAEGKGTPEQYAKVNEHFNYLKKMTEEGRVVLAGPSTEPPYTGIVIFHAEDEAAAKKIMDRDPAVAAGLFQARLSPFRMSLSRS